MFLRLSSRIAVLVAAFAGIVFLAAAARADTNGASAYVSEGVNHGLAILGNASLSDDARRSQFSDLILSRTDARKIAYFTLGNYRRGADEAALADFVEAFRDYAVAVYESRLANYSGQTLNVTGSVERAANDYVVNAELEDGGTTYAVGFRVLGSGASYQIVDIMVEGIWLAIDQRSQFGSFLSQNDGDIPALSAYLRGQTSSIRAGNG